MSAQAFELVSRRLAKVLRDGMDSRPTVVHTPPTADDSGSTGLSLWLYQVTADEFVRNAPPPAAETANGQAVRYRLPPLGVNLYYLLTPLNSNPLTQQTHLAEAMLTLHENSVVRTPDPDDPTDTAAGESEVSEAFRVGLVSDSLDDRARLWDTLNRPYRLSVVYQVRTVRLVSKRTERAGVVGQLSTAPRRRGG